MAAKKTQRTSRLSALATFATLHMHGTSDLVFAIDFGTSGTSALALQPSNYVMPTLTGMSFKSRMNLRSLNCWRNIDMSGATSSFFLTSDPLLPGSSQPFLLQLSWHRVHPGVILP